MKKIKIEIQVILLTVGIAVAVMVSGYLAYQSLSMIVDTIHKEARPDLKLLLIKDIASDLNEVENTIRLYSLTGDKSYLQPYSQLDSAIQQKLDSLAVYSKPGSDEVSHIDSIAVLANRKLMIWDAIRALHYSKPDAHNTFNQLYSKIDTAIIQPDTIRFQQEEKKGFFKRIFSKKDTTTRRPLIIDKTKEKEIIKKEIAGIEQQITKQSKQLQIKERVLLEKNIKITEALNQHIASIESSEQKHLETKTQEADSMAAKTYRGMAIYTVAAVFLLIVILIVFMRNIQKNRIYQQILRKAKADAENLTKAKEMFVATVSHEMRTPVNAIYGLSEQMLQKSNSVEMTADLKVVHHSAEHLIALVNDTLDFSKIESQKMKLEQVDFKPDEILAEIDILHKDPVRKKGLELIINNRTDKDLVLLGDPVRLKQILINLVTNAIKFTSQGQIILTFSGEEASEQDFLLRIQVSDTGIGISKENLNLIFDEFVQLGTDLTQKQRGAGLGLSIVKKLIKLLNGHIEVESIPGKGTIFNIQIPYRKGDPKSLEKQLNEILPVPPWFRQLNFLIVDDEEYNLYLMKNILKKWNVSYTEAQNGQEAIQQVLEKSFDLILMDIRMPVMNGYEATKLILQNRPSSKIIALTATTNHTDIQHIELAGMHSFLQKPFTESDLIKAIQAILPEKAETMHPEMKVENTIFDLDELERISGGDKIFFAEMLSIFIRTSEDALKKIGQSFHDSDFYTLTETAHKLAAPAKHLKATSLYSHLKELENSAENSNPEELKKLIGIIESEITQINAILNRKLNEN